MIVENMWPRPATNNPQPRHRPSSHFHRGPLGSSRDTAAAATTRMRGQLLLRLPRLLPRLLLLFLLLLAAASFPPQARARTLHTSGGDCPLCLPGVDCLPWTSDVARDVAGFACSGTTDLQCTSAWRNDEGVYLAGPPMRCYYNVTKDDCITQARSYAQGGESVACRGYTAGEGDCDASSFQSFADAVIDGACDKAASGAVVPW
ncbi:hypothetical protein PLESTF_001219000 [Pleodorina starrii]|nr:hypothetical protein PLESTM_000305800 [Pleodorina starrii]GLC72207.1 hypothetical protein PLESTF_001219000 [Pleodorina starrii]